MRHRKLLAVVPALGTLTALATGCPGAKAPTSATCGSESRLQLDCESEVSFDSRKIEGGFSAFGVGANAKTEVIALRQVDDAIQQYVVGWKRLCDEYNKCVLDKEQYAARSDDMRRRLGHVQDLHARVKGAEGEGRAKAVSEAYDALVPADKRVDLGFEFSVLARLPNEETPHQIRAGAKLPTDSHINFAVRPSTTAHVYIYQQTPKGEVTVLFPSPKNPLRNPLSPDAELTIPPETSFRLNDQDIGTERVFIMASLTRVPELETGDTAQITKIQAACTRSLVEECPRALVQQGVGNVPQRVKAEAAASKALYVFEFQHTAK
jgi:hypothetical protein